MTADDPRPAPPQRLAFVGLGNMGLPMATNLVDAGFDVVGVDLREEQVARLVEAGGRASTDPAAAVADADVVLSSLPGPAQVRAVGESIVPAMRPGAVWLELSTNDLGCGRQMAALAERHGIGFLDAPVTGGAEGAAAGTLSILCGGSPEVHERVRPVLTAIGERHHLLGPSGAGYVAKIASVSLCYLHSVCLTEALLLGARGGVRPDAMLDVIQHSTGRSYVADRYGPEILNGGYDATFDLGLARKDLRLAVDLAATTRADLPFTADVLALYEAAESVHGFAAPHLIAMQLLESRNDLVLHQSAVPSSTTAPTPEKALP